MGKAYVDAMWSAFGGPPRDSLGASAAEAKGSRRWESPGVAVLLSHPMRPEQEQQSAGSQGGLRGGGGIARRNGVLDNVSCFVDR